MRNTPTSSKPTKSTCPAPIVLRRRTLQAITAWNLNFVRPFLAFIVVFLFFDIVSARIRPPFPLPIPPRANVGDGGADSSESENRGADSEEEEKDEEEIIVGRNTNVKYFEKMNKDDKEDGSEEAEEEEEIPANVVMKGDVGGIRLFE